MRKVWEEIDALRKMILALQLRTTFGGGGVPPSQHAVLHEDGESDAVNILNLAGYPDPLDSSVVLRGNRTFGPALGSAGAGQWIPLAVNNGSMVLNAEGHPVLVWWDGP